MAIGTGTALLAGALVGAAANAYGASRSAKAAKEAAAVQSRAVRQATGVQNQSLADALAFMRDTWAQTQANQAPWLSTGQAALGNLAHLMGIKVPKTAPVSLTAPASPTAPAGPTTPGATGRAVTRNPTLLPPTTIGGARHPTADSAVGRATTPSAPGAGQMVWMQAPNGRRAQVPSSQVQHYLSLGAQIIQG